MHSAGLIVYIQKNREITYLILKNKWKPGFSFPKGLIQRGESPLAAAIRETCEETGLTTEDYVLSLNRHFDVAVEVEKTRRFGDGIKKVRLFFARLVSPKKDIVLSKEHSVYLWLRSSELGVLHPQFRNIVLENEDHVVNAMCDIVL